MRRAVVSRAAAREKLRPATDCMGVNWQFWTDQPPSPVNPPPAPPPLIVEGAALPTEDQVRAFLSLSIARSRH